MIHSASTGATPGFSVPLRRPSPEELERKEPAPHKEQESRPRSKDDGESMRESGHGDFKHSVVGVCAASHARPVVFPFLLSVLDVASNGHDGLYSRICRESTLWYDDYGGLRSRNGGL